MQVESVVAPGDQFVLEVLQIVVPLAAVVLSGWIGYLSARRASASDHERALERDERAAQRQAKERRETESREAAVVALERIDEMWSEYRHFSIGDDPRFVARLDPVLFHVAGRAVAHIRDEHTRKSAREAVYAVFYAHRAVEAGTMLGEALPYVRQRRVIVAGANVLQAHIRGDALPQAQQDSIRKLWEEVKRGEALLDSLYEGYEASRREELGQRPVAGSRDDAAEN